MLSVIQEPPRTRGRPLHETTVAERVHGKGVSFSVALFGGKDEETGEDYNWSLSPLQAPRDEHKHLVLARNIERACLMLGVHTLYAPSPLEFNGKIARAEELRVTIDLWDKAELRRGVRADGIVIPKGAGYALSAAGCPIIVATDGETFVAAHAGLKSLVRANEPLFQSVTFNISRCFSWLRRPYAWVFYAIVPQRYPHSRTDPEYACVNDELLRWMDRMGLSQCISGDGCIDLPALIRLQFMKLGVLCSRQRDFCYLPAGAYDTRMPEPERRCRNLILVSLNDIEA